MTTAVPLVEKGQRRQFVFERLLEAGSAGVLRDDLVHAGVSNLWLGAHVESLRGEGFPIAESTERLPSGRIDTRLRLEILPDVAGKKSASPDATKQVERPTATQEPLPEKEPIG